ncbi:MAG: PASTA domain-containing protein [Leptotrichiaceae bacterium]|nr:PASTA domain-containing protein [Leptotrichiaceae bacterium]
MAKKFKFNIIKTIITLACLIILATIGKEVFFRHFFNKRHTVIPNVVNLHEKDALKYLKEAGLKVKIINSKTEKVPLDTVFIQFPLAGKEVKVNRTVQIWVNNGEGQEVPNLVGLELLEARSLLQGQNIQIEKIDYQPSNQKYNTIIGVYPRPGTKLEINQKISILVSSQKILDASIMPNLIGLDINDAKVLLAQIGLTLGGTSKGEDPTLPVNAIISTSPAPGAKISKGQKISIVINTGVKVEPTGPSVEEIINQTNQDLNNQEIENIINDTLNKIEKRDNPGNNQNNDGNQQQNNQKKPENTNEEVERTSNDN